MHDAAIDANPIPMPVAVQRQKSGELAADVIDNEIKPRKQPVYAQMESA